MPQVGEMVAGKYRIERIIGEGGMGAVFAASHALTGKRVALKWMLPELAANEAAAQRFMREAQAAGRIDHPNVVDIYDVGEHEGSTFLVMEYLQGETLTAAFARGGLDAQQVIRLLLPAMRGVAAAHKMGVVHRDLKPDNIFLCSDADGDYREPKVLDFGISKVSSTEGQLNPRLTRTGAVMGTPYYMSPEQIRGSAEVDHRTDVYAFGVILYEALTGQVPFDADAYSALILEIATGTPKRPRELRAELPAELEAVVLKAMAREPQQRYPDVESLARALEPFADGLTFRVDRSDASRSSRLGTSTTPFTSEGPSAVPVRRRPLGLVLLGAGVLAAGAAVSFAFLVPSSKTEPDHVVQPLAPAAVAPAPAPVAPVAAPSPAPVPVPGARPAPPISKAVDAGVEAPRGAKGSEATPSRTETPGSDSAGKPKRPHSVRAPSSGTSPTGRTGQLNANEF
jgi:serine/threonine-protein kinase